eukprot:3073751-Rhodomonas_salina.2
MVLTSYAMSRQCICGPDIAYRVLTSHAESNTKGQRPLGPKRHAPGKFSGKKSLHNGGNDVKERSSSAEQEQNERARGCLLYTSDAADDM